MIVEGGQNETRKKKEKEQIRIEKSRYLYKKKRDVRLYYTKISTLTQHGQGVTKKK
jgi:hypothetical protein